MVDAKLTNNVTKSVIKASISRNSFYLFRSVSSKSLKHWSSNLPLLCIRLVHCSSINLPKRNERLSLMFINHKTSLIQIKVHVVFMECLSLTYLPLSFFFPLLSAFFCLRKRKAINLSLHGDESISTI